MTTNSTSKVPTWDQLLTSISDGAKHPNETKWDIFRYLQQNYKTIGSKMARTLLAAYMKLHVKEPSLINSCLLGMAAKISETYADFQLPKFLEAFGYDSCLRNEDRQRQTGKGGRKYLALVERVDRALQAYLLHHPEESRDGCDAIVSMYAAAMFEKVKNGRKQRFVKLVAANGTALIADSHQFSCRPYDTLGRMFDVLIRLSKQGGERAADIVPSQKAVQEVFATCVGYVDGIDESHGHIHIYDSQSRHFVVTASTLARSAVNLTVRSGDFVLFCPVIAQGDHFKSAAIVGKVDKYKGRETFGTYTARILYVNTQEQYIKYAVTSDIPSTPEGIISKEGFASTASMAEEARRTLAAGQFVRLTLFLKRGKDGVKRNHVAEVF